MEEKDAVRSPAVVGDNAAGGGVLCGRAATRVGLGVSKANGAMGEKEASVKGAGLGVGKVVGCLRSERAMRGVKMVKVSWGEPYVGGVLGRVA